MKNTGIVRKVDELGRVVIPMELRRTMNIPEGAPLEIFVDEDQIILKQHRPSCSFCEEVKDVVEFKGKKICKACLKELRG